MKQLSSSIFLARCKCPTLSKLSIKSWRSLSAGYLSGVLAAALLLSSEVLADFPNTPQTPGNLLSHNAPEMGRLAIIDILGDYVITIPEKPSSPAGSDFLIRAWDISNPSNPVVVDTFGETGHPFLAHGSIKYENEIFVGGGYPNDAIRLEDDGSLVRTAWTGPTGHWGKSGMNRPWAGRDFWTYNGDNGNAWLELDGEVTAEWDHLGATGVYGFPMFMGNLMIYASDQSNTGVATYDISDPQNPQLLDVLNAADVHPTIKDVAWDGVESNINYGIGGYWNEIYGHYVVFVRRLDNPGIQVVDFSDPSNLRLHCDFLAKDPAFGLEPDSDGNFGNPMYVGFQDEYVFAERYKLNIETCEVELVLQEIANKVETSQYSRPIGNLLLTGGTGNYLLNNNPAGLGIWAHQTQADTNPPYVAYHIPQDNQSNYPVFAPISLMIPETLRSETIIPGDTLTLTAVDGGQVDVVYVLSHAGLLTVDPVNDLAPNTTYELRLAGVQDAVENAMEPYTFRFSTGNAVDNSGVVNNNSAPQLTNLTVIPEQDVLVGNQVTISATGTDSDGDSLEYRFRSEGQAGGEYGPWSSDSSQSYTYDAPGTYRVNIQVRDTSNATSTSTRNIAVYSSIGQGLSASTSSPVSLDAAFGYVWTVNPDNDSLSRISAQNNTLEGEFPVGDDPRTVAVANDGSVWVTLFGADLIRIFDASGSLLDTISTGYGTAPFGIVMSPNGQEAYVSLYGSGQVIALNTSTRSIVDEVALPGSARSDMASTPRALAVSPDGSRLLVTRFISDQNWAEVYDIGLDTFTLDRVIRLSQSITPDDLDDGRGVLNYLSSVVISHDGDWAYVVGTKDNTGAGLLNGNPDLDEDNTIRTFLSTIDLNSGSELVSQRIDFDNADSPTAITLSPNGDYLMVAIQGRNEVWAFSRNVDTGLLSFPAAAQFETGLAPQGVYLDGDAGNLFVKNFTDRTLSVIELEAFLSSGELNPDSTVVDTVLNESLDPDVLVGKQIFYNAAYGIEGDDEETIGLVSAEGYISCASCHIDGGQNGRVYDFTGRGEGLRNNISLKGRSGVRFGDVHWSGNFDEIHDFEHDIRGAFLGRGLMTDEQFNLAGEPDGALKEGLSSDLDALSAYVTSLNKDSLARSPYRSTSGSMTLSAARGQQVFVDSGCVDCHVGKAYTDGESHDVGTLREYSGSRLGDTLDAIKTPSLLGLHESAPYLHDGSALTVADVFNTAGGSVVQAETGSLGAGASLVTPSNFSYLRDGGGVRLTGSGTVTVSADGGDGGEGLVRVRYGSSDSGSELVLSVNGTSHSYSMLSLPQVQSTDVSFAEASFQVILNSGNNTLELSVDSGSVLVDDLTVSNIDDLSLASPHLIAQTLSEAEMTDLANFLVQLDQASAPTDEEDPFEPVVIEEVNFSENWVMCANEGEYCSFDGTHLVRYGAQGTYETMTFVSGVDCNNDTFGDPIRHVVKACEYLVLEEVEIDTPTSDPIPDPIPDPTPVLDTPVSDGDNLTPLAGSNGGSGHNGPLMIVALLGALFSRKRVLISIVKGFKASRAMLG